MSRNYTISEIARLCGTSKSTVSRVLNNPKLVARPLREKVLGKIKELGYEPNPFAAKLGARGSWGIALMVFDILNPFFSLMVREIGHLTMDHRIPLTVCDTANDPDKEKVYLTYLLRSRSGGMIITEGISESLIERARRKLPVVLIDQRDGDGRVSSVTSDNYQGVSQAVDYLIQLNHTRIGFVTGPLEWITAEERFRAFRDTLARNRLPYDQSLVFNGDFQYESGIAALEYFLSLPEWPTAIFCSNDQMALGILNKAQALNISIPNDISVVGFDGLPLFGLRAMGLTTVKQDVPLMCRHAVDLLTEQMDGPTESRQIVVPTQFIIGNTCKKIQA